MTKLLLWAIVLAPVALNLWITLASYLWQRRCNQEIYKQLDRLRREKAAQ